MNSQKKLRYVLIAVATLILVLLALQFWAVKNKRYFFQGSVAFPAGPPGRLIVLADDLPGRESLRSTWVRLALIPAVFQPGAVVGLLDDHTVTSRNVSRSATYISEARTCLG